MPIHVRPLRTIALGVLLAAIQLRAVAQAGAQSNTAPPRPPAPGAPKAFRLPPKRVVTLDNGMRLVFVHFGTVPRVHVELDVRTGRIDNPADGAEVSQLTAAMLDQGTATRTAAQIADEAAAMGGSVNTWPGSDVTTIGGDPLAEHGAEFVRLIGDVALHPSFPADQFARVRADALRDRSIALSQPGQIAEDHFRRVMFGDHPYARLWDTEDALKAYTVDRVRAFHAANFGARRATLYVIGVFDSAAVERAARETFTGWAAGPPPTEHPPVPASTRSLTLVDRPGALQSTINLGVPVADPSSPDYIALDVTNALLGGSFASRITANIREQKGYTYSPYSFVSTRRRSAYWEEAADVTTDKTGASLTEIFGEIDRLRREAPPAAELRGIQNYIAGLFTVQNGSRSGIAYQLSFVDVHGLPDSYLRDYVGRTMATTPEDVRRAAERWLAPERMTLVVVGDEKTVRPQVAPFGRTTP